VSGLSPAKALEIGQIDPVDTLTKASAGPQLKDDEMTDYIKKTTAALRSPTAKKTLAITFALAGVAKAFGLLPESVAQGLAIVKLLVALL
jgi:hypothetical protein